MKYLHFFIVLFFMSQSVSQTQSTQQGPAGEYYLKGVMETAAGFKLNPDSSFEFFFSYGVLDRTGSGRWKQEANNIILSSEKQYEQPLSLMAEKKIPGNQIVVHIDEKDPFLAGAFYCLLKDGHTDLQGKTNQDGEMIFKHATGDSILFATELFPEKRIAFAINTKKSNHFTFKVEAHALDVHFSDLRLNWEPGKLSGAIPLLKPGNYQFLSAKQQEH